MAYRRSQEIEQKLEAVHSHRAWRVCRSPIGNNYWRFDSHGFPLPGRPPRGQNIRSEKRAEGWQSVLYSGPPLPGCRATQAASTGYGSEATATTGRRRTSTTDAKRRKDA